MSGTEGKAAVLAAVAKILAEKDSLTDVSVKSIREQLVPEFGDAVALYKDDIKQHILDTAMVPASANTTEENEGSTEEDEESDEEEPEEESGNAIFDTLPDEWKANYGSIIWAKTEKSFPWYTIALRN
jgi:hypothetical protein